MSERGFGLHKKINKKICTALAIIILLFIMLFGQSGLVYADSNDISDQVTIEGISLQVYRDNKWVYIMDTDGQLVDSNLPLYTFELVRFRIDWSIGDVTDVREGDFFNIAIPSTFFTIAPMSPTPFYENGDESLRKLGEWSNTGDNIHVVLTDHADILCVENGYFVFDGIVSPIAGGDNPTIGGREIVIAEDTKIVGQENKIDGRVAKAGQQLANMDVIEWNVYVNYDNYKKVYSKQVPEQLDNVILVDEIAADQEFLDAPNDLVIRTIVYMPAANGSMSDVRAFDIPLKGVFTRLYPTAEDSYEEFFEIIESMPASYGVYDQTIIINFGDLPNNGDGIKRPWRDDAELLDYIYDNDISGAAAFIIFDALSSQNTARGDLIGFNVRIRTRPADTGSDKPVSNKATLYFNTASESTEEINVSYQSRSGGANTRQNNKVTLVKIDDETGEPLEGVTFKIQKQNEDGEFFDYMPNDGVPVKATNEYGVVVFDRLEYGVYRVVEVEGLPGYIPDEVWYFPNDKFTISEGANDIQLIAVNFPDNENQFMSDDNNMLFLIKTDGVTEEPLEGVKFKLQKQNASGVFVDYIPDSGVSIEETNIYGIIVFEKLEPGTYKIIEVQGLAGYSSDVTYSDPYKDGIFTIPDSADSEFILITVENYPSVPIPKNSGEKDPETPPVTPKPGGNNSFIPLSTPKTGDGRMLLLYGIISFVSLTFIAVSLRRIKKRNRSSKFKT